uniref:Uncharacterized protein n=1 Tax=Chelydra serpentina TaxID=8475 RepID=A0A8C3SNZ9_CHESE
GVEAMAAVTGLRGRVEALERRVIGPGRPRKAADGLVKVQVALGNIASKRERIKILYKKSKYSSSICVLWCFLLQGLDPNCILHGGLVGWPV